MFMFVSNTSRQFVSNGYKGKHFCEKNQNNI